MSYIEKEKAIENVSQIRLEVVGGRAVGKTILTEALHTYRDAVLKSLNEALTADVEEVRHGEWELEHETYGKMRCSICKKECPTERKPDPYEDYQMTDFYVTSPYCPECGAKMDGEGREE